MKKNNIILLFLALLTIPFVLAVFPGIPHQFYGGVIVNGVSQTSGTIIAKINNQTVGSTQISFGKYGWNPIFFIEDPDYNLNGKKIIFYINNLEAGNYIFENGESTRLDLIVGNYTNICGDSILGGNEECDNGNLNGKRCDNSNRDCSYCSASCMIVNLKEDKDNDNNGNGGRIRELSFSCNPNWKCTNWGECSDGIITRDCQDTNECGNTIDKPAESKTCDLSMVKVDREGKEGINFSFWALLILSLLIIAILVVFVNKGF